MTTKHSPLRVLTLQAHKMAETLKAIERGEKVDMRYAAKLSAMTSKETLKFGILMDDKVITIEMTWALIRDTTEVGLSEYILRQMREARDVAH